MLAFLVALIFNGSVALLIEFLSDRLPEIDDIESTVGKPVLGVVPQLAFRSAVVEQLDQMSARNRIAPAPLPEVAVPPAATPRRSGSG